MIALMFVLQAGAGMQASVVSLVLHSSLFAKFILLLLGVVSVWSWAIVWDRLRLFARVERADKVFANAFRHLGAGGNLRLLCDQNPQSALARIAREGHQRLDGVAVGDDRGWDFAARAMERKAGEEGSVLEAHVGFLATTGSVAPFVGLMGTVWGVMAAFLNIGTQGSASLVVVAPGIAEALIATVAGLAAAIPAVVAYNHSLSRIRDFTNRAGAFISEFIDARRAGAGS